MAYTIKKLSELSRVSTRTLRWYDEIGLLKPAFYGSNQYRYYEETQLLKLQQILFFRELGFPLEDIQRILLSSDFDQLEALSKHKQALEKRVDQTKELINTIDTTILHLRGNQIMKPEEFYHGFKDWMKDYGKEELLIKKFDGSEDLSSAEKIVLNSVIINTKPPEKKEWEAILKQSNQIYREITKCLIENLEPKSSEVQSAIKKHCEFTSQYHQMSREVYLALAELYSSKKEYRDQLDPFHPQLYDYIARAMSIYAYNDLD